MKNILLMGLTDHEAAAVEIMIGMNWRDHRCITLKRERRCHPEQRRRPSCEPACWICSAWACASIRRPTPRA